MKSAQAKSVDSEKLQFSSNLLSTFFCSVVVSLAAFAWLRVDISTNIEMSLECAATLVFMFDIYLSRRDHRVFFKSPAGIATISLGVIPWYTLANVLLSGKHHPLYIMLAHSSFVPYLLIRFRFLSKEHIAPRAVKIAFGINLFFFAMHWLATAWMLLQPRADSDFYTEYNMAMYYLMTTITTIGYGDITPSSNAGRLFAMGLELMGVCVFGAVIGQLSRIIMNADRRKEHAQNEMEALVSLVKHYDIPVDLQKKSYRFFRHLLSSSSNEEELRVLSRLPQTLQSEIRVYMNAKPLAKVSILQNCHQKCLIDTAHELRQEFFSPGQKIISKGEIGDSMFLIGHGKVQVHNGLEVITELDDGHCFGEMALLSNEVRKADVTAITHCDIFVLSRERFQHLMETHADLRDSVSAVSSKRGQQKTA